MKIASIPRRPDVPRPPDLPDRPDRGGGGGWSRRRMTGLLLVTVFVMLASLAGIAVVAPIAGLGDASTSRGPEYEFLYASAEGPYRWDPCLPIHYQANVTDAPDGVIDDLDEVIDRLEGDTGIEFVFDGLTERTDREQQRSAFLRPNVADTPLPVLITWVGPDDFRRYANPRRYAGVGQPVKATGAFDEYRSGMIVINTGGLRLGFADRGSNGLILQHEWGHVLGLGHVASREELMWSPDVEGAAASPDPWLTDWGPGDMEGLRALGRQAGCLS